jgi:hypothetical protein
MFTAMIERSTEVPKELQLTHTTKKCNIDKELSQQSSETFVSFDFTVDNTVLGQHVKTKSNLEYTELYEDTKKTEYFE